MRTRKEAVESEYQQVRADAAGLLTRDMLFCTNHQDKRECYYLEESIRAKSREWALMRAYRLVIEMEERGLGHLAGRAKPCTVPIYLTRFTAPGNLSPDLPRLEILVPIYRALC
eukprot:g26290.t1